MSEKTTLTLGSLFDGSGGFPLGGLLVGITPIWASEIEPFPIRVTTKRIPFMKHYGDISAMNGAEVEPVDIITFGSPCQDMSISGKRTGLDGSRSSLFYEAVRIIKEMRCATNGKYPRYIVWENVPGAFSSNKGQDFKAVLDAVIGIKEPDAEVPMPEKGRWPYADVYMGDGWSLAYRTLDAQYWGVPQRRKRIYLVADFTGRSAGKILFESEGLSGYSAEGFRSWQRTTCRVEERAYPSGTICLNDQGGNRMNMTEDVEATLRAENHGHPPCVMEAVVYENHSQDTRFKELDGVAPTVSATYGTGGNNQPLVVEPLCDLNVSVYAMTTTSDAKIASEKCPTLMARDYKDPVVIIEPLHNHYASYGIDRATYNMGKNAKFGIVIEEELEPTLVAKGAGAVAHPNSSQRTEKLRLASDCDETASVNATEQEYSVRRLTPTECSRLQGFPDWWCDDLGTENPTEKEINFWTEVFETHRKVTDASKKPKTHNQIVKWLKNPHSDSAEYKMWGNGVALPCVYFVMSGIAWADTEFTVQ